MVNGNLVFGLLFFCTLVHTTEITVAVDKILDVVIAQTVTFHIGEITVVANDPTDATAATATSPVLTVIALSVVTLTSTDIAEQLSFSAADVILDAPFQVTIADATVPV